MFIYFLMVFIQIHFALLFSLALKFHKYRK